MPCAILGVHLFSGVDRETTAGAALAFGCFLSSERKLLCVSNGGFSIGGDKGGGVAVPETLGSEELSIAGTAMNFLVRAITSQHRIKWPVAFRTVKAFLVPHSSFSQLLFSSEDHSSAAGTTLSLGCLDRRGIRVVIRTASRNFFLSQAVCLEETGTTSKTIAVGSPFLAVTSLAVDVVVRSVASDDRVQSLGAIATFEALAMPLATLSEDLLSSKHNTAAPRATLAGWGFDRSGINHRGLRCLITIGVRVTLQDASSFSVTVSLRTKLLAIAYFTINVFIWALATVRGVKSFQAVAAFEALLVPPPSPSQHLFGSVNITTTARASLAGWRLGDDAGFEACSVGPNVRILAL